MAASRWHEAYTLACQGHSNKQIAAQMSTSLQTVKNHLRLAYRQMRLVYPEIGDRSPRSYFAYQQGRRDCERRRSRTQPEQTGAT